MLRQTSDAFLRVLARLRLRLKLRKGEIRVNVGAGLEVAPGWLHLDGSIHALVAGAPAPILKKLYRRSRGVRNLLSEDEYVRRLTDYDFIFCDFEDGLPFPSDSVDFMFSCHTLEHFGPDAVARLVREMWRVLKPGARVRIGVPDLERAVRLYQAGSKREALQFCFTRESSKFEQHRYMYDFELLRDLLAEQAS